MAEAVLNSWTVDALAEFLNSQDLRGPAATLQGAGVKGSDFAAWTYTFRAVARQLWQRSDNVRWHVLGVS